MTAQVLTLNIGYGLSMVAINNKIDWVIIRLYNVDIISRPISAHYLSNLSIDSSLSGLLMQSIDRTVSWKLCMIMKSQDSLILITGVLESLLLSEINPY